MTINRHQCQPRTRPDGTCRKKAYASPAKAKKAARGMAGQFGRKQRAYQCERCQQWHLATER